MKLICTLAHFNRFLYFLAMFVFVIEKKKTRQTSRLFGIRFQCGEKKNSRHKDLVDLIDWKQYVEQNLWQIEK